MLSSAYHTYNVTINAEYMRKKKRNKNIQRIKARNPVNRSKWLRFEIVTLSGSCEWTVHEKKTGGRNERMARAGIILPGWPVRKIKLL